MKVARASWGNRWREPHLTRLLGECESGRRASYIPTFVVFYFFCDNFLLLLRRGFKSACELLYFGTFRTTTEQHLLILVFYLSLRWMEIPKEGRLDHAGQFG